ncbi:LysR family transcriptional regulator [Leifsonia shinshuensis]|uniref:DNA-binding transcriptional LysR family regulator n=1 Tax=Leifsonia shinshuensis TaxID=150026 RepID=A0A853D120_9MICO|nr:LysR family transcriptional regulator [Leifsonia shinshuensis]NYJ25823.1 DNA-binding transcriptional LysR family regulator [Leifsonia shinshuensis]
MDVPIHTLRYFCVLAEELHFAAAAARLNISPPSLSQQISRLESVVGEPLFERTSRAVALTTAGEELLPHARRAVDAHQDVIDWITARHNAPAPVLRIGVVAAGAGPLTSRAIASAVQRIPGLRLEMRKVGFFDPQVELAAGRVDAVFAPAPLAVDEDVVTATPMWTEPRVLVVPAGHHLAERASITIDETRDETFVAVSGGDPRAIAWWLVDPRPDGSHPRVGPVAQDIDGILALVGAGMGVNIAAASAATHYRRSELAFVPIEDIEPATILLCTRRRRDPVVAAFVAVVEAEARAARA